METELRAVTCCGVFVEFCDERGNCVAQSAYLDWDSKLIPVVGDVLSCGTTNAETGCDAIFSGRVRSRQFDIQRDAAGAVSVFVRLIVSQDPNRSGSSDETRRGFPSLAFSPN